MPGEWCMAIACTSLKNCQCQTHGTWKSQTCPVQILVVGDEMESSLRCDAARKASRWRLDGRELGVRPSPAWHRLGNLCCT